MIASSRSLVLPAALLALAATGCASTPRTQFHTLLRPAAPAADAAASAPFSIDLAPVGIPDGVDHPQLVLREGAGKVALVEDRQWIGPLPGELRAALAAHLSERLGAREVHALGGASGQPLYRIRVDVTRFESVLAGHARIDASWSVRAPDAAGAVVCSGQVQHPVAAGFEALVEGHQQAVVDIADRIAQTVQALDRGTEPAC